jgi:hypothetical protein
VVRYTLDKKIPTDRSPVLAEPMQLDESTDLTLQVFDLENNPLGYPRWIRYEKGTFITDPSKLIRDQQIPE